MIELDETWSRSTTPVCPVALDQLVELRLLDGQERVVPASFANWAEVVAYRLAPTKGIGDIASSEKGSGARYNSGKPPFELIPVWLIAAYWGHRTPASRCLKLLGLWQEGGNVERLLDVLRELGAGGWCECAHVFDYGRGKYAAWNWAKGMPWSVPFACAVRHLLAMEAGEELDPESKLPHRGHVFCNIVMLATYQRTYLVGDDRPSPALLTSIGTAQ